MGRVEKLIGIGFDGTGGLIHALPGWGDAELAAFAQGYETGWNTALADVRPTEEVEPL